tara:strand:- start:18 stop:599 length:582 start_codon:yes stop_codon:yes gene_type:complete
MPYKDPEAKKKYAREYREKNRDKINARLKEWRKGEGPRKKQQEYKEKNKEKHKKYWVEYRKRPGHKEKFNKYYRNWVNKKLKEDPNFKLKQILSHRVYLALKAKGISKSKRTKELLGCTTEELWMHLKENFTEGMTVENYGLWHIDHIKPCALFDLTDPKQQEECFHYTNLQPLWAIDNIRKGKTYESTLSVV